MEVIETKTYQGQLSLKAYDETDEALFISSSDEPLAALLEEDISGKMVSVRYWITDKEVGRDAAQEEFLMSLMGAADCEFGAHYSEVTGYLWTDQEIKIGGHDLLHELESYVGEWLILEVDIHQKAAD